MLPIETVKHINKLQQKKFRKEFQELVVEGVKGVREALESSASVVLVIAEGGKGDEFKEIVQLAEKKGVQVEFCGRKDIGDIKTTDTFPGILAVVEQKDLDLDDLVGGYILCLDEIKDPGNLGTIIRTADWFGIENILLSENSVDVYNPKVVRSTMGSVFRVNTFVSGNLLNSIQALKEKHGYSVFSLDMSGDSLDSMKAGKKTVFILGGESHGIREEIGKLVDKKYTIPGSGKAESLNVSIAGGILMNKL